jgi:hypothetical protein
MTTSHEIAARSAADEWLATLDPIVRANTYTSETIKEHWLTNSPRQLAIAFADAVNQRVWEQIAYMPAVESKREVRSYSFVGWMRECIGAEPDEFVRTITGHNPSAEEGSTATIAMVELLANEEPETLRELCVDHRHGETNMLGWDGLLKQKESTDPAWSAARVALQEAVKNEPGRPKKNAAQCAALNPTHGADRKPKDRKSRLIRTLTNLASNPDECKTKGTTPEKVEAAKARLVRGLTPSVEAAKREAGIALPAKPHGGLGVRGAANDVAKRLIKTVGAEHAKRIANAVLEMLTND